MTVCVVNKACIKGVPKEVKTVPLCPAAALRRLDIGVGIVGDGILKNLQITIYRNRIQRGDAFPSRDFKS